MSPGFDARSCWRASEPLAASHTHGTPVLAGSGTACFDLIELTLDMAGFLVWIPAWTLKK